MDIWVMNMSHEIFPIMELTKILFLKMKIRIFWVFTVLKRVLFISANQIHCLQADIWLVEMIFFTLKIFFASATETRFLKCAISKNYTHLTLTWLDAESKTGHFWPLNGWPILVTWLVVLTFSFFFVLLLTRKCWNDPFSNFFWNFFTAEFNFTIIV